MQKKAKKLRKEEHSDFAADEIDDPLCEDQEKLCLELVLKDRQEYSSKALQQWIFNEDVSTVMNGTPFSKDGIIGTLKKCW